MNTKLIVLIALMFLSGCMPSTTARFDMQSSKGAYKDCLTQYPNETEKCDGLKKQFEIDKQAVEAMGGSKPRGVILLNK